MATSPIVRLRRTGETLDPALRSEVLALGPACVPELVEMFEERVAGWPCYHAAGILIDLGATDAVVPLLRTAAHVECDDATGVLITMRLPELGAVILEPVLAFLEQNRSDIGVVYAAADVLVGLEIRDPRIFAAILLALKADASIGAELLATYGDPRGMDVIGTTIAEFEPDFSNEYSQTSLETLLDVYEQSGRTLTDEVQQRVDGWLARWRGPEEQEDDFALPN